MFKLGIFTTVAVLISFVVGLRGGVEGVVVAYTVALYLTAYPVFAIAFRLVDMKVKEALAPLWSITLAAFALGIVAFLFQISLGKLGVTQDLAILIVMTGSSLLIYSLVLFLLDKKLFIGIVRLLGHLRTVDTA
jgi:PST family polysaccharide transporter